MYIEQDKRQPSYEFVVNALMKGFMNAVNLRDKSHVTYVMLRSAVLAWIELGGGYNNGSDIKAMLNDVADEFTARVTHSLKGKKEKNGDVDNPIKLPKLDELNLGIKRGSAESIVDLNDKPLKSED